MSSFHRHFFLS